MVFYFYIISIKKSANEVTSHARLNAVTIYQYLRLPIFREQANMQLKIIKTAGRKNPIRPSGKAKRN